jgi:hypothetical protein
MLLNVELEERGAPVPSFCAHGRRARSVLIAEVLYTRVRQEFRVTNKAVSDIGVTTSIGRNCLQISFAV